MAGKTDPAQLCPYLDSGMQLVPLHNHDHFGVHKGKRRDRGKSPVDANWTKRAYRSMDQVDHMRGGDNVGVRLRASELVVDVDPRNFPEDPLTGERQTLASRDNPFRRLCEDAGLDPSAFPTVVTGSGGLHVYMAKPADLSTRDSLPAYEGVEFKTLGRQVVAAGSVHPLTKRAYEWDVLGPELDALGPEPAPAALLDLIARPAGATATGGGEHDQEELAAMLAHLDPEDFRDQDRWFTLMQACHHATAGDGRQEFVDWSTGDPQYADDGGVIGRRWDSLHVGGDGARVTYRTLHKFLRDAGRGDAVPRPSAADDFDAVSPDEVPPEATEEAKEDASPGSGTPMELARAMLRGRYYLRSNGDWLRYDARANKYEVIPDETFSAQTWSWVDKRPYIRDGEAKAVVATRDVVANVVAAAVAQRQGPRTLPCWHPRRGGDPDPADLLAVVNGLLHLPNMSLLPPTPRFVCHNASPVAFDPLAPAPARWERFLSEVFPNDAETASTLQEVMGYLLTQDTSQQKIFCLVGPMRSGKGTINRVIQALVGAGNYSSPAISDLAQQFGMERLIGRQLATISDMRMGRNSDPAALAENLLRVSGEDELSVNRKHKGAWEGRLNTRVMMLSNETPQFRDTSGAIVSRFVLMQSTVSFLGREDTNLTRDLLAELPGILNWCLAGLARLRARGHFVQPKASLDALATMDAIASPVKAFAAQRLSDADREAETPKDEVWEAFYEWLDEAGLRYGGDRGHFFKDLGTVGLRFTSTRPRVNGERVQAVRASPSSSWKAPSGQALASED